MRGWKKVFEGSMPTTTREVMMISSQRDDVFSAQYVESQDTWYHSNTNDEVISPLLWRDFPSNPIINE